MESPDQPKKSIVIPFPDDILKEMDALAKLNYMGRSEYIIHALRAMLDYLETQAASSSAPARPNEPGPGLFRYTDDDDDSFSEAAEDEGMGD